MLRVRGPILYRDRLNRPAVHFREGDVDTTVSVRSEAAAAYQYILDQARPGSPGVVELQLNVPGQGVITNNRILIHGRTEFVDTTSNTRVLARKWWSSTVGYAAASHVPGLWAHESYLGVCDEIFGIDRTLGAWHFDAAAGVDVREPA